MILGILYNITAHSMEARQVVEQTDEIVGCIKACQQQEIIDTFRILRKRIAERQLYVLFEDILNCDVHTDHLKPKNVLPIFQKYIDDAETYLLQVPFAKEQQAVKKIVARANNDLASQHIYLHSRAMQFGALFDSSNALVGEMERVIIQLATDKGRDKNALLGEIQFLKEQLINKKNLSAQYKPDFSEILEAPQQGQLQFPPRNEKLLQEKETATRNAARLSKQLIELQQLQENSRKQIDAMRQMLAEYDKMKNTYDAIVRQLEEKQMDYQNTSELLISAREAITQLNKQLEQQKGQIDSLDFQLKGQTTLAHAEAERIAYEKEQQVIDLQEQLQSLQEQYAQINSTCVELNTQLQDVRFQNQQHAKAIKLADDEKMQLRKEIQELRSQAAKEEVLVQDSAEQQSPDDLKQKQIQLKLAEMQRQKQEQIEAQARRLLQIESDAFRLITGLKAAPQDQPQQLRDVFWSRHEKKLKEEQQKAAIGNSLAKIRTSSASSFGNDSFTDDGAHATASDVVSEPAFKKMLAKCPQAVQQYFEKMQAQILELQQQVKQSLVSAPGNQFAVSNNTLQPQNQSGQHENLSDAKSLLPEDVLTLQMALGDRKIKEQLSVLKHQLEDETQRFSEACTSGGLDESQIASMVMRQRDLVDRFNNQLNELAQMDISIIEKVQAEIARHGNPVNSSNVMQTEAVGAKSVYDKAVQVNTTQSKPAGRTPKTTLDAETSGRGSKDSAASKTAACASENAVNASKAEEGLANRDLGASQLRLSQIDDAIQDAQQLQQVVYQPRISMRELADHYDTLALGYNASGQQMLVPNQHEKWQAQITALNNMLHQRGIPAVADAQDLWGALQQKKAEVQHYYDARKMVYDHKAVIKTLRGANSMLDSLIIINSGGQRRFYTLLGSKLVRTLGSNQQTRSLSQGSSGLTRSLNQNNFRRPSQLRASDHAPMQVKSVSKAGLPFLNIKQ